MEPIETLVSDNNNLLDEEEEEDEDVDFNPFLKDTPSREPSSSLSSELEPPLLDGEIVNSQQQQQPIQTVEQLDDTIQTQEEDDAICKRTRARYSLKSFTLDDLEAFLQESDDEDDFHNVDDEAEYRKFLAAVLNSGDGNTEVENVPSGNNNDEEDDDEDNDLDFEIELEEALETDDELEIVPEKVPVTRQKRRQSVSNTEEETGRVLRPILPIGQPERRYRDVSTSSSSGFSEAQMGELQCLMQDHVQLLVQVYSLCVLDHSRSNVGTQVHGLFSEMIKRKEEHRFFTGSVRHVVDQAGRYLRDVSTAVQDYRRCQLESSYDASSLRVPLFPLPHSATSTSRLPSDQQQSRKTLAATLAESAKNQSVALVHKDIAKLAKRFVPLFKVSLFPHKPPAAAVVNRFLFTSAEDELLALGIMEYNTDWKTIRQRFLPCKGEHQIYVRQKNRRSSKAPENSIKAVLRIKSSPLNPQEVVRIQEGLKYFKYDWRLVWRFIVPYRDPSLLPRQLRTALGIQKSYKQDPVKKEKRRLYDTEKRKQSSSAKEDRYSASKPNGNHVGSYLVDNSGGAYLHEGFLADWRLGMPNLFYSTSMHSYEKAKDVPRDRHESVQTCTGEGSTNPELVQRLVPLYHHSSGTTPGCSSAPITAQPYGTRDNRSVVRLAPDLPPLNLPSTVRVISQSAFGNNQSATTSNTCIVKGGLSNVSKRGNVGTGRPSFPSDGDNNDPRSEKVVDVPAESSSGMSEKNNGSDLQLHPLLFRTPSNRAPEGSSSYSFFSENRPQLLSLFNSPKQTNPPADEFQKNSSLDKHEVAPGDSCLHPLFKRNECETRCVISKSGNLDPAIGKKGKLCRLEDTSGAREKTSIHGASRRDVSLKPLSASKHAKNVNLDIYLSPTSSKVKSGDSVSAADSLEGPDTCMVQQSDGSKVPGLTALSRCIDELGDQSNQGIVMEQEELSDSDEEMMEEENVEFECEEMADSEGDEGSECEEIIEMQDKENKTSGVEVASTVVDSGKELGRDSPSSPWLSLDPSSRHLNSMVKDIEETDPANKVTVSQYGPSRSRRKRTPRRSRDAESKEDADVARLRLGPLALPSMKKPRKCARGTSPSIETT